MRGKASGLPKMGSSKMINGKTPQTKGGPPATGAGKNTASGKAASKITKVR